MFDVPAPGLSVGGFTFTPKLGDRDLFPELRPLVYANHAAISPPSIAVRHALLAVYDDYAKYGVDAFPRWHAQRARLLGKLETFIGAEPGEVALS